MVVDEMLTTGHVRTLLALENIFVDQDFSNKEQAIQFLCGTLVLTGVLNIRLS